MVNDILPTSIILENPKITYKPWLEYLEGDDLNMHVDDMKNETKKFLCKNVLYNKELVEIDGNMHCLSVYGKGYDLVFVNTRLGETDCDLYEKYGGVDCYLLDLDISYNSLMSNTVFSKDGSLDFKVVPLLYKDFYADIDIEHMMHDYNSFSTIVDVSRGIIYINDVLLNYMKMHNSTTYKVLCNVLVRTKKVVASDYASRDNPECRQDLRDNNEIVVCNAYTNDKTEVPKFTLDYLPKDVVLATVSQPTYFMTDDRRYFISIVNMPYRIYSTYHDNANGALYYNKKFGYFSQDKNRTAINVLAYDICNNGICKPLMFKYCNGKLVAQDKARLLIAQYLKLPYVPAIVYQSIDDSNMIKYKDINLVDKDKRTKISNDDIEFKRLLYPTLPDYILQNTKI